MRFFTYPLCLAKAFASRSNALIQPAYFHNRLGDGLPPAVAGKSFDAPLQRVHFHQRHAGRVIHGRILERQSVTAESFFWFWRSESAARQQLAEIRREGAPCFALWPRLSSHRARKLLVLKIRGPDRGRAGIRGCCIPHGCRSTSRRKRPSRGSIRPPDNACRRGQTSRRV